MITRFKIYDSLENKNEDPEIFDYIIVNIRNDSNIARLINKKVGRIMMKYKTSLIYVAQFGTVEFRIKREEILHFSKDKEELENLLKYNL